MPTTPTKMVPEGPTRRPLKERLAEWARVERFIAVVLLGGWAFVLLVTGIVLVTYYRPTGGDAYHDMKYLQFDIPLGMLMLNMHRQASSQFAWVLIVHALLTVVAWLLGLHQRRSWPRRLATAVLACALAALPVTGRLIPWDELSIWAVTVGTNMARATPRLGHEGPFADLVGKDERYDARSHLTAGRLVGPPSMMRFFFLHCIAAPLMVVVLVAALRWRRWRFGTESR
jgi:quinol-cytochrome oxidoreductase complex cytochrome b subunit